MMGVILRFKILAQAVINTSELMILALVNKYKRLLNMPKAKATVNIENVVTTATQSEN